MRFKLHVWRQRDRLSKGRFETYSIDDASPDMSFLEMLDVVNERLIERDRDPIAFEHDCREGVCGSLPNSLVSCRPDWPKIPRCSDSWRHLPRASRRRWTVSVVLPAR